MKKIISFLALSLLVFNIPMSQAVQKERTNYTYESDYEYDFENNSYNISDEQLEDIKNIDKIEEESGMDIKVINSSHFSSGTATRTYIPINKIQIIQLQQ